jgi:hypothetical protein
LSASRSPRGIGFSAWRCRKGHVPATYVHSQPDALSTAAQSFARVVAISDNSV